MCGRCDYSDTSAACPADIVVEDGSDGDKRGRRGERRARKVPRQEREERADEDRREEMTTREMCVETGGRRRGEGKRGEAEGKGGRE